MTESKIKYELDQLIKSFDNIKTDHIDYYTELVEKYTKVAENLDKEYEDEDFENISPITIRKDLLKNDVKRNFFTITSKNDFTSFPTLKMNNNWGGSICYHPLNDHSRHLIKRNDIVFCYRIGQFSSLGVALDTRGIYGIGFVCSEPKELFLEEDGHNRWGVQICFPIQLMNHLKLRNIQLHPETIDLTPYNGNRNDALQHIPDEKKYLTLLNLLIASNPELKDQISILIPEFNYQDIRLPEIVLEEVYTSNIKLPEQNNPLIHLFIDWANRPENFKKSYAGLLYYPILKSWDEIFFENQIFQLNQKAPIDSLKSIQEKINNTNEEWKLFNESASNGAPAAVLGKNNYLKFLEELIGNKEDLESLFGQIEKDSSEFEKDTEETFQNDELFNELRIAPNTIDNSITKNLILYGAPGTGKSFELKERANKYFNDEFLQSRCTFHSNYSYRNFIGSYKPKPIYVESDKKIFNSDKLTENNYQKAPLIEYIFEPGPFLTLFERAIKYPNHNFLLLIEELNRANTASVFGDIFQLLDRDSTGKSEYSIIVEPAIKDYLASKNLHFDKIKIPSNLFIWATMNNADQGVQPLDSAFKRRWSFEHVALDANQDLRDGININIPQFNKMKEIEWNQFRKVLNNKLLNLGIHEDKLIGPFFLKEEEILNSSIVKNKLLLYLKEDVLKYKSGIFKDDLKTFSMISEKFDKGDNIFIENIMWDE